MYIMKKAIITKATAPINWAQIPAISIDELVEIDPTDITASAQICYDENALYLRLSATESEIRAVESGPIGNPCEDSCLEFFFSLMEGDIRYFNFEFNPNACLYLGLGSCVADLTRLIPAEEEGNGMEYNFHPVATRNGEHWQIQYQIPYSFIRRFFPDFTVYPGKTMRANFYKCADLTTVPHYLAWNPITRKGSCVFHTPSDFGLLRFE